MINSTKQHYHIFKEIDWMLLWISLVFRNWKSSLFHSSVDSNCARKHNSIKWILSIFLEKSPVNNFSHCRWLFKVKVSWMDYWSIFHLYNNWCAPWFQLIKGICKNTLSHTNFGNNFSHTFNFFVLLVVSELPNPIG